MKIHFKIYSLVIISLIGISQGKAQVWQAIEPDNLPEKRHENAMAAVNGKLYLLGGRGIKPVNEYDLKKDTWTELSKSPIEMR
jgi:N-acetylneuraminic acid mutarotase